MASSKTIATRHKAKIWGAHEALKMSAKKEINMAVARVTELIAASNKSFEDAVETGFKRAVKTLRNITGFHVTEWKASVQNEEIKEYRVTLKVSFLLEDTI